MSAASLALADPQLRAEWEREAASTLKRLGFPSTETPASCASILPKVLSCLTKRLEKLGEFSQELEEATKEALKQQKEATATASKKVAPQDPGTEEPIVSRILA